MFYIYKSSDFVKKYSQSKQCRKSVSKVSGVEMKVIICKKLFLITILFLKTT